MEEMSLHRRVELLEEELRDLNRRMQLLEPTAPAIPEQMPAPVAEKCREEMVSSVSSVSSVSMAQPPAIPQAVLDAIQNPLSEPFAAEMEAEPAMSQMESSAAVKPAATQKKHQFLPDNGEAELWMGQVWAVRIGVLLMFTGFVFLANYAWEHYISQLGALPRLIMLSLLAVGGVVAGEIMRRKPRLGTFGEVIAAGGLAALYYCAFASHHIHRLRVIESPSLGAVILTITGLGILGYGAWRRASVMCAIALLLSFYGTSIQPVVLTAMISGLIVSVAGAWLCLHFQWRSLGVVGLIGAYVSFTLWQGLLYASPAFSLGSWFLVTYWLLYNAVVLHQKNPWDNRGTVVICTLNYGLLAAFLPFDWSRFVWDPRCWMVYAGLAMVSLIIWGWLEKSRGRHLLSETFLVQGIGLLTLGIVTKWSGHKLFLVLAVKGVVLLGWDRFSQRKNIEICGSLLLLLSSFFALIADPDAVTAWIWFVYAMVLLIGVCVARRDFSKTGDEISLCETNRWLVSAISLIALVSGVLAPMPNHQGELLMIAISTGFTAGFRYLRQRFPAPEYAFLALCAASLAELRLCSHCTLVHEWVLVAGTCLAFLHAVVNTQTIANRKNPKVSERFGIMLTLSAWLLMGCYFLAKMPFNTWTPLAATTIMVGIYTLARWAKWNILRSSAPLFAIAVMIMIVPDLFHTTLPIYATFTLLLGYAAWLTLRSTEPIMSISPLLCGTLGISCLLALESHGCIYLLLLPLALYLTPLRNSKSWRVSMGLWVTLSFILYTTEPNHQWLTYVVPALWYGALAFRARMMGGISVRWTKTIAVLITLSAAAKATGWIDMNGGTHHLTILWALLAVLCFAIGFLIKEAIMRVMMLLLLLASMGNILASVWQLGTLMRIASFLVTGMIFLLLGYVYNKHPEWFGKKNDKRAEPDHSTPA